MPAGEERGALWEAGKKKKAKGPLLLLNGNAAAATDNRMLMGVGPIFFSAEKRRAPGQPRRGKGHCRLSPARIASTALPTFFCSKGTSQLMHFFSPAKSCCCWEEAEAEAGCCYFCTFFSPFFLPFSLCSLHSRTKAIGGIGPPTVIIVVEAKEHF